MPVSVIFTDQMTQQKVAPVRAGATFFVGGASRHSFFYFVYFVTFVAFVRNLPLRYGRDCEGWVHTKATKDTKKGRRI